MFGVKLEPVSDALLPRRTVDGLAFSAGAPVGVGHGFVDGLGTGDGDGLRLGVGLAFGVAFGVLPPVVGVEGELGWGVGLFPGVGLPLGVPFGRAVGPADGVGLGSVPGATTSRGRTSGQTEFQHSQT
jgi:hypothetical protein